MTSLKDLQALGAFVSEKPANKTIKFKLPNGDGELVEHETQIFVKQLSVGDYESLFVTDGKDRSQTAQVISAAITLGKDGSERISFKDAYRLHPALATSMLSAFYEVNTPKKSSQVATDSSAN